MAEMFDDILDKCIDRINRGDRLEDCLADYPEHADELKLPLESVFSTRDAYSYKPQPSARQRARQRFNVALRESEERQEKSGFPFPWILGRARAWAVIATVAVIAFGGYFGIMQLTSEEPAPGVIPAESNSEGNFAFLISDAPNAIGDFQSLDLTFSKIRLRQGNGDWVEFVPETGQVDLTRLQNDLAQQVWRGDVPEGEYTGVVLYVVSSRGVLNNTGDTVNIELKGDKLHLDIDFEVATGSGTDPTEFVYDVTVISTDGGYHLQPVPGLSGTGRQIRKGEMQGQT
ncbi:DUF4382 domain-containing protein [Chloroflexota bacterium]